MPMSVFLNYIISYLDAHAGAITALATVLIAAFTIILARIACHSERAIRVIERAYVRMTHIKPGIIWDEDETGDSYFGERDGTCSIRMEIKNCGNTPAEITDVCLIHYLLNSEDTLPDIPNYSGRKVQKLFRSFLVKDELFISTEYIGIREGSLEQIRTGFKSLFVIGYVDYLDKFGNRHRSGYARKYNPLIDLQLALDANDLARVFKHADPDNLDFINQAGYNYDRQRKKGEGNDWD